MPEYEHVLDNRARTVVDYLRGSLIAADSFRLVSAYFTVYGYELLADQLDRLHDVRFLFGDPSSIDDLDPESKDPKSFVSTDKGLEPSHALHLKELSKRCIEWVKSEGVQVRSISRSNFLHGKMYLSSSDVGAAAVVGSSNFTRSGLGGGSRPNLEINLATSDRAICSELLHWFDALWNDQRLTQDVKEQVLTALRRIGRDHAPELIYFKTLYELFRDQIDARLERDARLGDIRLPETAVWNALYEFQRDGVRSVINRLQERGGCILADSVGLGKTYTALAVIKHFELEGKRVLVLCPRKLRENWALYPAHFAQTGNPFREDRFAYTLLSHTDLSRDRGDAGGVELSNVDWGDFGLVVIDESHNFRNHTGQRYQRLIDEVIRKGADTKVLMLSATPVNTSLIDLRNQIYLMTAGSDDAFKDTLGISNVGSTLSAAQRVFRNWEQGRNGAGEADKSKLIDAFEPDFLRLLDAVSISRSRRQIERFYADEMERIGSFPVHDKPDNRYPKTDLRGKLSYRELAHQIEQFQLSIYQPSRYLVDEERRKELEAERKVSNFTQEDRERYLIAMLRTNFLKRLESSPHALTLTLSRTVGKIDGLLERIARFEAQAPDGAPSLWAATVSSADGAQDDAAADFLPDDDEEDEDFIINRGRSPFRLRELDLDTWKDDLVRDRAVLEGARKQVAAITPERDGKLREITKAIREKVESPRIDQDGRPNRKLLVFTTFKDTAEYLYEHLGSLADELDLNMAMVSGDTTRTSLGANNFNAILTNFAPMARQRGENGGSEIDLLIATDCISEGQNLQDCDATINYDIHWNPVRIIQRFGRIDRIGSRNQTVRMLNFWPTDDMEIYLGLENRVRARMALADMAGSGQDNLLTEDSVQLELTFRDKQLLRLLDEIPDLDELDDSPSMSDLTLDHFFSQLLQYLKKNQRELEELPLGAYAVTDPAHDRAGPGVIFLLRHVGGRLQAGQRMASQVHPYYLVYVLEDGQVRFGCGNAQQVLELFSIVTDGKSEPIRRLCDRFDAETENGRDMSKYSDLLDKAIGHIADAHNRTQVRNLGLRGGRDFVLPRKGEAPTAPENFELVTWLVMLDPA